MVKAPPLPESVKMLMRLREHLKYPANPERVVDRLIQYRDKEEDLPYWYLDDIIELFESTAAIRKAFVAIQNRVEKDTDLFYRDDLIYDLVEESELPKKTHEGNVFEHVAKRLIMTEDAVRKAFYKEEKRRP